jgi:hypothetical protein
MPIGARLGQGAQFLVMEDLQADLELTLLHIRHAEQKVADQHARIEHLRREGAATDNAEDMLKTLQESLALLKQHLARMTGPVDPDSSSS